MANPVGRPRTLDSPDQLWEFFEAYRNEVKSNPRIKIEYVGKMGDRVETPIERPLTLEGFRCFCWDHVGDTSHYFKGDYEEFSQVIARIRESVRQEQIDGAMSGFYNSNLTARLNGLAEKQSVEVKTEQPLFPDK
jgi:hypothetical protein